MRLIGNINGRLICNFRFRGLEAILMGVIVGNTNGSLVGNIINGRL